MGGGGGGGSEPRTGIIYIDFFFYSEVFAAINLPCLQQTTSASFQVCYI